MPVCVSGTLCADAAGNDNNPATFFYPVNEFIAVVSLVGQNHCRSDQTAPAKPVPYRCHCGSRWRAKSVMDSQAHPLPHGLSSSNLPCSAPFPRDIPFFSSTGMLVDFNRGAVQHQRCFIHQVLLYQSYKDSFPYTSFCPSSKPAVYTLPGSESLWQIPPWNPCVQPV